MNFVRICKKHHGFGKKYVENDTKISEKQNELLLSGNLRTPLKNCAQKDHSSVFDGSSYASEWDGAEHLWTNASADCGPACFR